MTSLIPEAKTFELVSQGRGADISDDTVSISRERAEEIMGWLLYITQKLRLKYHHNAQSPKHIKVPLKALQTLQRLQAAEKTEAGYVKTLGPGEERIEVGELEEEIDYRELTEEEIAQAEEDARESLRNSGRGKEGKKPWNKRSMIQNDLIPSEKDDSKIRRRGRLGIRLI